MGLGYPKQEVENIVLRHFQQTGTQHLTPTDLLSDVQRAFNDEQQELLQAPVSYHRESNNVDIGMLIINKLGTASKAQK